MLRKRYSVLLILAVCIIGVLFLVYKAKAVGGPPATPTLSTPTSGATGVSTTPSFSLSTTDADLSWRTTGSPLTISGNGDKILIYTKNQLVIIYRPSINKIAAVGTVSIDKASIESQNATITVLDGSNNPQKTQEVIAKIKAAYPSMNVTDGGKTARQNFPSTIVIDNTNQKDELLLALVDAISGQQGVLPQSVPVSNSDFMVIVGQD